MTDFAPIMIILDQVINDRTVPKNIRAAAEASKSVLSGSDSEKLKISTAVHSLEEVINDPNMPIYTRTQIWNIVSMLEQASREIK